MTRVQLLQISPAGSVGETGLGSSKLRDESNIQISIFAEPRFLFNRNTDMWLNAYSSLNRRNEPLKGRLLNIMTWITFT